MGEKEIRPAPGVGQDSVARVPPAGTPMTAEKPGTGRPATPMTPTEIAESVAEAARKAAADSQSAEAAKSPETETLSRDGWREGRDAQGNRYAVDPQGNRGQWDPKRQAYVDPRTQQPFPKGWGSGHQP